MNWAKEWGGRGATAVENAIFQEETYRAAWMADHEPAQSRLAIAAAKAYAGYAGRLVCGEAIQLHGGVGSTWEYDPHIDLKRVKTLEQFYGSTSRQLEAALSAAGI